MLRPNEKDGDKPFAGKGEAFDTPAFHTNRFARSHAPPGNSMPASFRSVRMRGSRMDFEIRLGLLIQECKDEGDAVLLESLDHYVTLLEERRERELMPLPSR